MAKTDTPESAKGSNEGDPPTEIGNDDDSNVASVTPKKDDESLKEEVEEGEEPEEAVDIEEIIARAEEGKPEALEQIKQLEKYYDYAFKKVMGDKEKEVILKHRKSYERKLNRRLELEEELEEKTSKNDGNNENIPAVVQLATPAIKKKKDNRRSATLGLRGDNSRCATNT